MLLDNCLNALFEPGAITSDSGQTTTIEPAPSASGSHGLLLDLPLLARTDEIGKEDGTNFRVYETVASEIASGPPGILADREPWYGGAIFMSTADMPLSVVEGGDDGIDSFFATLLDNGDVATTTRKYGCPYAQVMGAPGPFRAFRTDYDNDLIVSPIAGQPFDELPETATYQEMIDEATLFAVGAQGRWVLGAYQTRIDNGDGTHTLSGLIMGLRGTDRHLADLAYGDAFVYLAYVNLLAEDEQSSFYDPVRRDLFPDASYGLYYAFRQTSVNGNLTDSTISVFKQNGVASTPPAPVHLKAEISGSDIVLSWNGRSRFPWHLTDTWNVESSETTNTYDIEIYDGATLKRTFSDVAAETKTYLAADIVTDFGSTPDTLRVIVYRKSAHVGRGYGADETLTVGSSIDIGANQPPVISSDGGGMSASVDVFENATAVTTVVATDPENGSDVLYSIIGGADAALFAIDATTGVLTFLVAPDYENPTDANTDNDYVVIVAASDGDLYDPQTITVTVHNVNESPTITSDGGGSTASVTVTEGFTFVTTVTAIDADAGTTLTYSISGGDDSALFTIDGSSGVLSFLSAPDHSSPADADSNNVYEVTVEVTDGSLTDSQDISVTVLSSTGSSNSYFGASYFGESYFGGYA